MFKKTKIILISLMAVIAIIMLIYFLFNFIIKDKEEIVLVDEIVEYEYTCKSNATTLFKQKFTDLSNALDDEVVDYDLYSRLLVQLFVIDFYTLDNKSNKNDVGGIQFIYPSINDNFILNATDTIYKYIKSDFFGKRDQDLPIVKDIEITEVNEIEYSYDNKTVDAYKLNAEWSYKEELGYETSGVFIVVREENKLYIIEKE